jgi:uncharacterized coiled-coil protein SlyX
MATTAQININVNASQAEKTIGDLNSELKQTTSSFNSMKAELRAITQELQGLEPGSARFQELSQRAGQLRDTIADTNAVINATAGNLTENFGKALGSSIQLGVAGFQTLSSLQLIFGSENEELNKSLSQMVALLNLSQAIETFGGLGDKLTQIKAGFTPVLQQLGLMATTQTEVAVATSAADVALVGEAVAADEAAVSTGFFGAALNALPFVAIISALGLLVAGLISYSSSSGDAEKQEKKRIATLKAQREEEKKATETIAKESAEYVGLIYQLKATNAGSTERKTLIKEINATYGTTIKNLSDETAFQQQLNNSIKDYIALQVIKVRQQKNVDKIVESIQKEEDAQKAYNIALGQAKKDADLFNVTFQEFRKGIYTSNDALTAAEIKLTQAKLKTQDLTLTAEELRKQQLELTKEFKNNGDAITVTTDKTKEATDTSNKYADALEKIKEELERQRAAEKGLQDIQNERLSRASAQVAEELKIVEDFNKTQEDLIKQATQREIEVLDERFKKGLVNEQEYIKGREEIEKGGLNNLLESETNLLNAKRLLVAEDLQNVKDKYALESEIVKQAITQINDETKLLQLQFQKEQEIDAITNSTLTEEKKQEAILAVKKKYLEEEKSLLQLSGKNQIDALTLQKDKLLENEQLTTDERKQIEDKYNQDVLKVSQDTQNKVQDAINGTKDTQKTALEELEDQISKVQDYLSAIADLYNQFSNTVSMISEARTQQREAEIDGLYAFEKEALENQLTEGLVSREQYENKLLELDQQREQEQQALAREEFETNKRLNIANAIINGAQAVLSTFAGTPGGPIIKSIAAGLAAAFAAVQIGVISSQQFTAAGGGIVPGMGSGMVDSVPSLLAPGETVINAQSSSMYPELLNQVNMAGGGISLKPDLPAVNKSNGDTRVFGDNKVDKPIRAYVVETDVTSTQKRVDRIKRSAEF